MFTLNFKNNFLPKKIKVLTKLFYLNTGGLSTLKLFRSESNHKWLELVEFEGFKLIA